MLGAKSLCSSGSKLSKFNGELLVDPIKYIQ